MRAFVKNCLRMVRSTFGRFASIFCITALGVAFFAGLHATAPDMRITAQEYFSRQNFMDFRLLSTAGFTSDDVAAIRAAKGVEGVMPAYSADAIVRMNDQRLTVKLLSLDTGASAADPSNINRPALERGRMPKDADECLADSRFLKLSGCKVGDEVTFTDGDGGSLSGTLKVSSFRVVGVAADPMYISYERGTSSIGSGAVNAYFLLPSGAFDMGAYSEVYVTVNNPGGISRFAENYDKHLQPVSQALEDLGAARVQVRYRQLQDEGRQKLNDAKAQLRQAQQQLADASAAIDSAKAQIADGRAQLVKAQRSYQAQIAAAQARLDASQAQYDAGQAAYAQQQTEWQKQQQSYESGAAQLEGQKSAAGLSGMSAADMQRLADQLAEEMKALPADAAAYRQLAAQAAALKQLIPAQQQLEAAAAPLAEGKSRLAAAAAQLTQAKAQLDEGSTQLTQQRAAGQAQLDAQQKKLDEAQAELSRSEQAFARQQADAQPKMAQAQQSITDGENALAALKVPQWYVLGNNTNEGFEGYRQDADRIAAISQVFPLIFFLVAALVSLTAMTRLVEDDRTYIGTMKALGYGRGVIAARYLLYAVAASLLGSAAGVAIGYNVFPRVIFDAYRILYTLPDLDSRFNVEYTVISAAAAVFCAAVPACLVCLASLRSSPAALMRPRSPQSGRRILLERVTPVWRRLNFSQKVTFRNLFRYKKRLLMTIAGVAGCTALLLTGFGLRDAISDIVGNQYGEIRTYDMQVDLKDNDSSADTQAVVSLLDGKGIRSLAVRQESADAVRGSRDKSVYLVVAQDTAALPDFIHLRTRIGRRPLAPTDSSVIVTEKLATLLGLKAGDTLRLRSNDGVQADVKVGGIAENYVFHYVYMTSGLYAKIFGKAPVSNQLLATLPDASRSAQDSLANELMNRPAVGGVDFISTLRGNFQKMITALRYVVFVLIFSAAALALVVLVSLTSINIDERERELATLRVLGFYPMEMGLYIYRENTVLTLLGTGIGLVLGIFMERFVVVTAEVDLVMFGRAILWQSYLWSALLTVGFAVFVNAVMFGRFRRIDMVTSLKSTE